MTKLKSLLKVMIVIVCLGLTKSTKFAVNYTGKYKDTNFFFVSANNVMSPNFSLKPENFSLRNTELNLDDSDEEREIAKNYEMYYKNVHAGWMIHKVVEKKNEADRYHERYIFYFDKDQKIPLHMNINMTEKSLQTQMLGYIPLENPKLPAHKKLNKNLLGVDKLMEMMSENPKCTFNGMPKIYLTYYKYQHDYMDPISLLPFFFSNAVFLRKQDIKKLDLLEFKSGRKSYLEIAQAQNQGTRFFPIYTITQELRRLIYLREDVQNLSKETSNNDDKFSTRLDKTLSSFFIDEAFRNKGLAQINENLTTSEEEVSSAFNLHVQSLRTNLFFEFNNTVVTKTQSDDTHYMNYLINHTHPGAFLMDKELSMKFTSDMKIYLKHAIVTRIFSLLNGKYFDLDYSFVFSDTTEKLLETKGEVEAENQVLDRVINYLDRVFQVYLDPLWLEIYHHLSNLKNFDAFLTKYVNKTTETEQFQKIFADGFFRFEEVDYIQSLFYQEVAMKNHKIINPYMDKFPGYINLFVEEKNLNRNLLLV